MWVCSWKLTATFAVFFSILDALALLNSIYGDRPYLDSVLWFLFAAFNAFMALVERRKQHARGASESEQGTTSD